MQMQQHKNIGEQERERVRQLIRSSLGTELAACKDLHAVVTAVVARRTSELSVPAGTAAGPAVMFLFGKIWRSFNAIRILAQEGYGPDAMVVARSLTNACIDLAYIAQKDSEERALQWGAVGMKAQREYLRQFDEKPEGAREVSWAVVEARAGRWKGLNIRDRARCVALEDAYNIAYKAGSSPEHSDSWSSTDYLEETPEGGISFQIGPSEIGVVRALSAACWGLSQAFLRWCRFFEFDEDNAAKRVMEIAHQFSQPREEKKGR